MTDIQNMPAGLREAARRAALLCLAEVAGVTAVVIATVDGFDLASACSARPARPASISCGRSSRATRSG